MVWFSSSHRKDLWACYMFVSRMFQQTPAAFKVQSSNSLSAVARLRRAKRHLHAGRELLKPICSARVSAIFAVHRGSACPPSVCVDQVMCFSPFFYSKIYIYILFFSSWVCKFLGQTALVSRWSMLFMCQSKWKAKSHQTFCTGN